MAKGRAGVDAFVEPGNVITGNARLGGGTSGVVPERMPQMPAFHLVEFRLSNIGTTLPVSALLASSLGVV